jgi:hypothetical protein
VARLIEQQPLAREARRTTRQERSAFSEWRSGGVHLASSGIAPSAKGRGPPLEVLMDTAHALRGAPSETLVMMERDATRGPPPTAGQTTLEIAETIPRGASRNLVPIPVAADHDEPNCDRRNWVWEKTLIVESSRPHNTGYC